MFALEVIGRAAGILAVACILDRTPPMSGKAMA
jgi:hypothetical protein